LTISDLILIFVGHFRNPSLDHRRPVQRK
jgi:hypothetical protein